MKVDKRDLVFSNLIRERANWTCERCDKVSPDGQVKGKAQGLDCSHFYGRRYTTLRWSPDNAAAHCRGCHQYLTSHPLEFSDWVRKYLGDGRYEMLKQRKNDPRIKYTKADKEDIYKHLKSELRKMKEQRADGVQGRINFQAFD